MCGRNERTALRIRYVIDSTLVFRNCSCGIYIPRYNAICCFLFYVCALLQLLLMHRLQKYKLLYRITLLNITIIINWLLTKIRKLSTRLLCAVVYCLSATEIATKIEIMYNCIQDNKTSNALFSERRMRYVSMEDRIKYYYGCKPTP